MQRKSLAKDQTEPPAEIVFMGSEISSQSLQISQSYAKAHLAIIQRVSRLRKRILRVHHFERGGFSSLVAQRRKAQAFRRELGGLAERIKLCAGGLSRVIENP